VPDRSRWSLQPASIGEAGCGFLKSDSFDKRYAIVKPIKQELLTDEFGYYPALRIN
jgi:hypothetical protein